MKLNLENKMKSNILNTTTTDLSSLETNRLLQQKPDLSKFYSLLKGDE